MQINKQTIDLLVNAKSESDGTSLITMYIPSESDSRLAVDFLSKERSSASNIKDKNVRNDVIAGIKSAIYQLKSYNHAKTPKNGLILCSGSISMEIGSRL